MSIDAGKTAPTISPYIYGQFIEHIGDLINRSLWAELLDDRKFYNDITSKPPVEPAAAVEAEAVDGADPRPPGCPSGRMTPW